jgi:eukaryotic-like serine/threonine-protein kinase
MSDDSSHTEIDPPSSAEGLHHAERDDDGGGLHHAGREGWATGQALDDPRVLAVVQEYMSELDSGRAPDRRSYLNRYPELAAAISQCLDGLELVRAAGPRSSGSTSRAAIPEVTPQALGDFQIIRELGRGGMGVVYEAVQLSLGRRVALKVLPFAATFDARQLQRFKNEAQAAALLHHTNIVPIYAVGCERGVHFYAMQLIEGHSLALLIGELREQAGLSTADKSGSSVSHSVEIAATDTYLAGAKPNMPVLPAPNNEQLRSTAGASLSLTARATRGDTYYQKVVRLMIQAADALEHAHQLGIVHRDIKPANLLVNTSGTLWIADFGLAQFQADASLTRTGDLVGTFRYMSPEQASGQRTSVDHRTDIYSLGATFYELLTLLPVFSGETRHELLYQILHNEPKAPRSINRAIPVELETIVLKALRKTPAERYASAAELADDLRRFLDHRPILARRPTLVDRARKWSRRHPSVVVAGVLILFLCLVGVSIGNWRAAVARDRIAQAQKATAEALEREKARANEAEESFRQARQSVDLLVEISEDEIGDNPFMRQMRRRLLQTALGFYQDFIDARRGDAASQADLAAVEKRVSGILDDLELLRRDERALLLRRPVVVRELGLGTEQRERINNLFRSWDEEEKSLRSAEKGLDDESRQERSIALAEQRAPSLERVLTAEQLDRLQQLAWQAEGLAAFREPEVVAELGLSREQRLAIRKIEREWFYEHFLKRDRGPHGPPPGPPEDRRPPVERDRPRKRGDHREGPSRDQEPPPPNQREAITDVLALLSPEQLARWRELTGAPVEGLNEPPSAEGRGPRRPPDDRRHDGPPRGERPHEEEPTDDATTR